MEVLPSSSSPSTSSKNIQDVISIVDIEVEEIERYSTGDSELDLVLGGGIVKGSLILIGGSPGIGKSTLLLKVAGYLAKERNILYVSGEESLSQIKLRADRLGVSEKSLYLFSEIEFEKIREKIEERDYSILIIDSIQTIYTNSLSSAP